MWFREVTWSAQWNPETSNPTTPVPMKSLTQNPFNALRLVPACALVLLASAQAAVVIESFESGTLNEWVGGELNGSTTTVNTDRASVGVYSAGNSFIVPPSFSGWTVNTILSIDPRTIMDGTATTLAVDVYSNWANPNGWGVYANTLRLVLNYEGGFQYVAPGVDTSLTNDSFVTFVWDLTAHAATITNPSLSYSSIGIGWHVGTWAGDGGGGTYTANGTQTFAIDNITITSVPEPSTAVALLAGGLLALRRRR
jgi:hypothetical protein